MIRLLSEGDESLLDSLKEQDWAACRIRSLARGYGLTSPLLRIYAEEKGRAFLSYEKDFAVLFLRDSSVKQEAEDLLMVTAGEVLSGTRLQLDGFQEKAGRVYKAGRLRSERLDGIESGIRSAYSLLSSSFPELINETTYPEWYADLSHRIRHGMSKLYVLPSICTGTMQCRENGVVTVAQLAVAPERRGSGWGRKMLEHIAADNQPFERLVLLSRDEKSDDFYERIGFIRIGSWYYYARQN